MKIWIFETRLDHEIVRKQLPRKVLNKVQQQRSGGYRFTAKMNRERMRIYKIKRK